MYEYKVVEANNPKNMEQVMNKMAAEGWRLVSTTPWSFSFSGIIVMTFEREK